MVINENKRSMNISTDCEVRLTFFCYISFYYTKLHAKHFESK